MPKVLVVDDDHSILDVVSIALSMYGYNVITESDGSKVLPKIEREKPDLILLDVNLSPYDGREICKEIKDRYGMPVILFSANIQIEKELGNCKAESFLPKPFQIEELESLVRRYAA